MSVTSLASRPCRKWGGHLSRPAMWVIRRTGGSASKILMTDCALPQFIRRYPDVSVDLHLSDAAVDLIG